MTRDSRIWAHHGSLTYRLDEPDVYLETVWAARTGWGYLMTRDVWLETEVAEEDLIAKGYVARRSSDSGFVRLCPTCGMYMCEVPGALAETHIAVCASSVENQLALDEFVLEQHRAAQFEARELRLKLKESEDLDAAEKRERTALMRDELLTRQRLKDRKKRLKEEIRGQLKDS